MQLLQLKYQILLTYYFTANVFSGLVLWEVKLQGRVESSAAILDDFSQVIDNFFLITL